MLEYQNHSVGFGVLMVGVPCFKSYKRNGKTFWRNYHRPVKGGISLLDWMMVKKIEAEGVMIAGLAQNVYS